MVSRPTLRAESNKILVLKVLILSGLILKRTFYIMKGLPYLHGQNHSKL